MSDAAESEAPAPQPEWGRRRFLIALLASVLTCFGLSYHLLGPSLLYDFRRHEPWLLLGMLTGHLTSAFWFSQYYFVHFVLGRPLTNRPFKRRRAWMLSFVFISMFIALIVGLGFTCYVDVHDKTALEAGALTQGQLVEVDARGPSGRPVYFCYYEFTDRQGEPYSGLFLIRNAQDPMFKKNQPALKVYPI